jgi:serine/threonine-protein kinase
MERAPPPVGPRPPLAGRYRLDARLGTGGMGTVYQGTDLTTGRTVAIKMLHANLATAEQFLKRFEREARVMAALSHPNLIKLLSIEHDELPFLVMPFVEGHSLSKHLKSRKRLSAREALPILAQLCEGLGYLHSRGIVHRDVKPDNVLLSSDGHVTLLDFGISRKGGPSELTVPGQMLGTVRYMAPEQALEQPIDLRADLYSLGLLTYHLLTGVTPFGVEGGHTTILKHLYEVPELASRMSPAVSDAVARVLAKSLAKDPTERHASAQAFFTDFSAAFSLDATASDTRNAETEQPAQATFRAVDEVTSPAQPAATGLVAAVKRLLGRG